MAHSQSSFLFWVGAACAVLVCGCGGDRSSDRAKKSETVAAQAPTPKPKPKPAPPKPELRVSGKTIFDGVEFAVQNRGSEIAELASAVSLEYQDENGKWVRVKEHGYRLGPDKCRKLMPGGELLPKPTGVLSPVPHRMTVKTCDGTHSFASPPVTPRD